MSERDTDPWTFFGSFSQGEIEGAKKLLLDAGITFEIKHDKSEGVYGPGRWSGPFALWVRDEHAARASDLLVSHFEKFK